MQHIGRYELLDVLGDGRMGTVYRSRDPRFDRIVAIKVLHAHLLRDAGLDFITQPDALAIGSGTRGGHHTPGLARARHRARRRHRPSSRPPAAAGAQAAALGER